MARTRMVVVGGDAAGMSAASQARRRRGPGELVASLVEAGGTIWGCSACTTPRGITEADLVSGAEIVGAATIVAAVAEGAVPVALG